jgi:hypothetical protein
VLLLLDLRSVNNVASSRRLPLKQLVLQHFSLTTGQAGINSDMAAEDLAVRQALVGQQVWLSNKTYVHCSSAAVHAAPPCIVPASCTHSHDLLLIYSSSFWHGSSCNAPPHVAQAAHYLKHHSSLCLCSQAAPRSAIRGPRGHGCPAPLLAAAAASRCCPMLAAA